MVLFSGYDFGTGLVSLGSNVRAIRKENIEQLDRLLNEIGEQLRQRVAGQA